MTPTRLVPEATAAPSTPALVPELDVFDLDVSLRFYVDVIGFARVFERRRERFAYLALGALGTRPA